MQRKNTLAQTKGIKTNAVTQLSVSSFAAALTLSAATMMSASVQANNPAPRIKAEAPNVYVVKKGDTLWDISSKYLNHPWRWREIWAANRQVKNPHRIWPGDKLILCIIKGKRYVGIDDGEGCAGLERNMTGRVSAKGARIRYESLGSAITAIPLSSIKSYLYNGQVVDPVAFNDTPYVVASKDRNIITGVGNKVYVRGPKLIVGQQYGVYRKGEPYFEPKTNAMLGQEVFQVASGIVTDVADNGISSLELKKSYREEVREGDRVFVDLDSSLPPIFYPKAGPSVQGASIIRVLGSLGTAAKDSVVTVNIGDYQGVKPGDVFSVYRKGALIRDDMNGGDAVRMPSERSGMLMVFKTFGKVAYAYVLESDIPLKIGDELRSPLGYDD